MQFTSCHWIITQNAGDGDVVALDDSGHILPAFASGDNLSLIDCVGVPNSDDTANPKSAWMAGRGAFVADNTRFGGETQLTICRIKTSIVYNGRTVPLGQAPSTVVLDKCELWSIGAHNWLEIYDAFPGIIDVRMPNIPASVASLGTWIDSVSLPVSSWTYQAKQLIEVNIDTFQPQLLKFRTSSDPASSTSTDVTDIVLNAYSIKTESLPGTSQYQNLFLSGKYKASQADTFGGTVGFTGTDSTTGYTVDTQTSSTGDDTGHFVSEFNTWGGSIPAGIYTFSCYVKSDSANGVLFYPDSSKGPAGEVQFDSGNEWERIEIPFYHDGSSHTIAIGMFGIANGSTTAIGLFQINPGPRATPYLFPGNTSSEPVLKGTYYGTAAPVSGDYIVGDVLINTAPTAGGYMGWVCVSAGSPGTWKGFGAIQS
jgi:hypothetical protein